MKIKFRLLIGLIIGLIIGTTLALYTKTLVTRFVTPKSFSDWCQQKSTLSPETRHTVEILLQKADTQNCELANESLSKLTSLDLDSHQISDIQPLSALTNLTSLWLDSNQISDIQPLSALTNLIELRLHSNQISDIQPLSALTNLTSLRLGSNQISEIQPLSALTNLTSLWLGPIKSVKSSHYQR